MTNMMLNFDLAERHQRELIEETARLRAESRGGGAHPLRAFIHALSGRPRHGENDARGRSRSKANAATA